ncbi:LOW QUALITY PROTEIN: hypothetical protein NC653_038852 [Populus alba x Populus x berolinensis]|uniref:Uncharacterized protein n=1 Tax=Populus alba x Populus x berolinensis TaxID=444605 RepID=A0AAD6PTQ0_9ROSI|nr:LOW QUALITY PROTEIN: hypothetical protein NC653_038852 [Populus alba x Populus x berolinensis]
MTGLGILHGKRIKWRFWLIVITTRGEIGLAQRFVPMAFAPDGLIEGFLMIQMLVNPEEVHNGDFNSIQKRMRQDDTDKFDYPGCPRDLIRQHNNTNWAIESESYQRNQNYEAGAEIPRVLKNTALKLTTREQD